MHNCLTAVSRIRSNRKFKRKYTSIAIILTVYAVRIAVEVKSERRTNGFAKPLVLLSVIGYFLTASVTFFYQFLFRKFGMLISLISFCGLGIPNPEDSNFGSSFPYSLVGTEEDGAR